MFLDSLLSFAGWTFLAVFSSGVLLLLCRVVNVSQGYVAVVERFGQPVRVIQGGPHVLWVPIHTLRKFGSIGGSEMLPIESTVYDGDEWRLVTGDRIVVRFRVHISYRIVNALLLPPTLSIVRTVEHIVRKQLVVMASKSNEYDAFVRQLRLSSSMEITDVNGTLENLGIALTSVDFIDIHLPDELESAEADLALQRVRSTFETAEAEAQQALAMRETTRTAELHRQQFKYERKLALERADADAAVICLLKEKTGDSLDALAAWRRAATGLE